MRTAWTLGILSALTLNMTAFAAVFPDVPDDHLYREAIEKLVGAQVINGNPDGTFRPEEAVNRAAMLKMLYKTAGKTPDPSHISCFKDVEKGSWYEPYVCDAAFHRDVQGYSDGTFRPAKSVTRAEGMKMALLILGVNVPEITSLNRELVKFVDISTSAWYTKFLSAAFNKGLLPIPGQSGARFYPDWPLLRGEAAQYIQNTLDLKLEEDRAEVQMELEAEAETSVTPESSENTSNEGGISSAGSAAAQFSSRSPIAPDRSIEIAFPFTDAQTFQDKASVSYTFALTAKKIVSVSVALKGGQAGGISCRLYRIEASGLSNEYYLGYQEDQRCYLLVSLNPGAYQLQVQPTTPNTSYTIDASEGKSGDGNDGFAEARGLERGNLRTEVLSPNDYEDWYKFTVNRETEMILKVTATKDVRCLIYPGSAVDLFGFSGPQCGEPYLFPVGTYIVGVGHVKPRAEKQTYTIQLK